jgi:hypothetical protein
MAEAEPSRWQCFNGVEVPNRIADEIWKAVAARMGLRT